MAWNKPSAAPKPAPKKPSALRGIAAGLVAVAVVAAGFFFLFSGDSGKVEIKKSEKKPTQIKEAVPAPAPRAKTNAVAKAEKEPEKDTRKTYRDERGILRYEGGMRVPGQRPVAKEPVDVWANKPKIFKHSAEDDVADILQWRLGEPVIGDLEYGEAFVKSFKEALADPTPVTDKDDEYSLALKKAVTETMAELQDRMKAGENVGKILTDTRKEYQQLGQYRHELEEQFHKIKNESENFTDEDYADLTSAINKMLEEKGLPPMKLPRTVAINLKLKGMQK